MNTLNHPSSLKICHHDQCLVCSDQNGHMAREESLLSLERDLFSDVQGIFALYFGLIFFMAYPRESHTTELSNTGKPEIGSTCRRQHPNCTDVLRAAVSIGNVSH